LFLQVVKGLLKFWPKTCSQKEVISVILYGVQKHDAEECHLYTLTPF